MSAELGSNPGYRSFLANGYNVTRCLVLFVWGGRDRGDGRREAAPARRASARTSWRQISAASSRHVRAAARTDRARGAVRHDASRPAVYATFSSYDEVAHHSGLERSDTMEALRKLDRQFGRIDRARAFAPRPYEFVVLSDHGQTQGATFRAAQRLRPRRAGGARRWSARPSSRSPRAMPTRASSRTRSKTHRSPQGRPPTPSRSRAPAARPWCSRPATWASST